MEKESNRQYEFDILRIIAISAVMLFHYTFRGYAADDMSILYFPMGAVFKYGYLGVSLFFMISGYTILLSLKNKSLKDYLVSRVLRLYPSFWVAVTLTTLITLLLGGERYHISLIQYLINLTMLNGFVYIESVDGVYWFMYYILKFYFLLAVILGLRLIKYQEYLVGLWLLFAIVIKFFDIPKLAFFLIPEYASLLIAGIIFQLAKTTGWNFYRFFIVFISLIFSIYLGTSANQGFQQHYHTSSSNLIMSLIIISFYLVFYIITVERSPLKISNNIVLYGSATYPFYLIHENIGFMIFNSVGQLLNKYLLLLMTSILMMFIAIVITKYIEPYIYRKFREIIEASLNNIQHLFFSIFHKTKI